MTLHAALPFHPTDSLPSQRGEVGTGEVNTRSLRGWYTGNKHPMPACSCLQPPVVTPGWVGQAAQQS